MNKIGCIIVIYNHDLKTLDKTIKSIIRQVDLLVIMNNNENKIELKIEDDKIEVFNFMENKGIAYGLNIGLEVCFRKKMSFILLSDQDTLYPYNYINNMINYINSLKIKNGIYSPAFLNRIKKRIEPIAIRMNKIKFPEINTEYYEVRHVINSGVLIDNRESISLVKFDEKLFIDFVDFEWCWRSYNNGFKIIALPKIVIEHDLGDKCKKIFNLKVTLRTSIRYYYMIRNCIYLSFFSKEVKKNERIYLLYWGIKMIAGVFFLDNKRGKNNKIIFQAVKDALNKNMGKKSE